MPGGFWSAVLLVGALLVPAAAAADTHECNGLTATIVGTDGPDFLVGTPGDDVIVGLGGDDRIRGRGGDDTLCAGPGRDRVWDGPGNDWVEFAHLAIAGAGNDTYAGVRTVSFENAPRRVKVDMRAEPDAAAGFGRDTFIDVFHVTGSPFDDVLRGNGLNNTLIGGGGADLIVGDRGDDDIRGNGGNDDLRGKRGDDRIDPGPGDDEVRGGDGFDTLELDRHDASVQISSLDPVTAHLTGLGNDTIRQMTGERLRCALGDTTVAAPFAVVECGPGNDSIGVHVEAEIDTGGGTNDVFQAVADPVSVDLGLGGANTVTFDAGAQIVHGRDSTGPNIISLGAGDDHVLGSPGDDQILLGAGNDSAFGGPGDDTISGGDGDDALAGWEGHDVLDGGAGTDVLEPGRGNDQLLTDGDDVVGYFISPHPIHVDLAARQTSGNGADTLAVIPFGIIGSPFGDRIVGSGHDTWFDGDGGDDRIEALGGADRLLGGPGRDILFGGSGDDWLDGGPGGDELWGGLGFDLCWVVSPDAFGSCEAIAAGDNPAWSETVTSLRQRIEAMLENWLD